MKQLCHRRVVISCGLHDHASLTVQAFEPPCQCAQFTIGVMDFKGRDDDLSEGAHDGNRASAFGNVDANRVHLHSSNLRIATGIHLFLIADSIYWVTRTLWLNLLKSNAAIRGWLTVSVSDMEAQGGIGQPVAPLIVA